MQISSKPGETIRHPLKINICQMRCKLEHHENKGNTGTSAECKLAVRNNISK